MNYVYPTTTRRRPASLLLTLLGWVALIAVATLTMLAAIHALDAQAAAQAQTLDQKRAAQKKEQKRATYVEQIAAQVCKESHGPDAVHYWDTSGVLVCAAAQAAMDTAAEAVRVAQQHASTGGAR